MKQTRLPMRAWNAAFVECIASVSLLAYPWGHAAAQEPESALAKHAQSSLNARDDLAMQASDLDVNRRNNDHIEAVEAPVVLAASGEFRADDAKELLENTRPVMPGVGYALRYTTGFDVEAPPSPQERPIAPPRPVNVRVYEFGLSYFGIPISARSGRTTIVVDGKPAFVRSRHIPVEKAEAALPGDADPSRALEECLRHARDAFAKVYGMMGSDLLRVDVVRGKPTERPHLEFWVSEAGVPVLSWSITLGSDSKETPFGRRYWVAVSEPRILEWHELVHFDHVARATGTIWPMDRSSAERITKDEPIPHLAVERVGLGGGSEVTGSDGRAHFPLDAATQGGSTIGVRAALRGPRCTVFSMDYKQLERSAFGKEGVDLPLAFGGGTPEVAQVTAFVGVNYAFDFSAGCLPRRPAKLENIGVFVNIKKSCNAYWDERTRTLNFYGEANPAQGACPNMAYGSVILHEFGHALDDEAMGIDHALPGLAYSEGFGDALSVLATGDPLIGRDFLGKGKALRDATQVVLWQPQGQSTRPHEQGKVYAGFTWELVNQVTEVFRREGLAQDAARSRALLEVKSLILRANQMNPDSIEKAVRFVLFIDAKGGSRYKTSVERAAISRGIPRPKNYADLSS